MKKLVLGMVSAALLVACSNGDSADEKVLNIQSTDEIQSADTAFAIATITKPEILLLDEHTAALDAKTSKRILEISSEQVKDHNLTALMITHNLQDALVYGNRMILLHHGKIIRDFNQEEKAQLTAGELYQIMADLAESDYKE